MQGVLWYEGYVMVGDGTTDIATWTMASHELLDFGNGSEAYVTLEYALSGPGAAVVAVGLDRSAARIDLDAAFQTMEPSSTPNTTWLLPIGSSAGIGVVSASYGMDQDFAVSARKLPRGLGRVRVVGTGTTGLWAVLWLRLSIALVRG